MKVFISSVISGYEAVRDAAVQAVTTLGHEVIRAEDFPASTISPQRACLAGVRAADVVVLVIGERYGYLQESGLSATHEEYREARERKPVLAFIEQGVTREQRQDDFLNEVQSWTAGHYTKSFRTPQELQGLVTRGLYEYALSNAAGPVNEAEMLERATALIPASRNSHESGLSLIVVGGPRQQIIRPAALESPDLALTIKKEARYGSAPIFDDSQGIQSHIEGHSLVVEQSDAAIILDEQGAVWITMPGRSDTHHNTTFLPTIVEEEVVDRLTRELRFANWLLDQIDTQHRLSDVVLLVVFSGANYLSWRTQAEHQASPNQASIGMRGMMHGERPVVVQLSPAQRKRAALALDTQHIVQDLVTLLRREMQA